MTRKKHQYFAISQADSVLYPPIHRQLEKIREFWARSNSDGKEDMIRIFDDQIREIEWDTLSENESMNIDESIEQLERIFK